MPRKVFVAGEILTAADVNTNLMDQAVMVFDDAAARDSAIGAPIEGMIVYLKNTNAVLSYSGSAWVSAVNTASIVDANVTANKLASNAVTTAKILDGNVTAAKLNADVKLGKILQVVQGVKSDTQSSSVSAAATVTISGLSASITPSSTASKVLVMVDLNVSSSGTEGFPFIVLRGATAISVGAASGSRKRVSGSINGPVGTGSLPNGAAVILDSPSTTSSITYTIDLQNRSGATRQAYVNRSEEDGSSNGQRSASRITLMEVAA